MTSFLQLNISFRTLGIRVVQALSNIWHQTLPAHAIKLTLTLPSLARPCWVLLPHRPQLNLLMAHQRIQALKHTANVNFRPLNVLPRTVLPRYVTNFSALSIPSGSSPKLTVYTSVPSASARRHISVNWKMRTKTLMATKTPLANSLMRTTPYAITSSTSRLV